MNESILAKQDRVVKLWRPNASESKPPVNPNPQNCTCCKEELRKKEPWSFLHGPATDWINTLKTFNSLEQCERWWASVSYILWPEEDDLLLCQAYIDMYSRLVRIEVWGDTRNGNSLKALSKYVPPKTRIAADEEWFYNNKHRIP